MGEKLWVGPEGADHSVSCDMEGTALTWDRRAGGNSHDSNRGLPYIQFFHLPASVTAGTKTFTITRSQDGQQVSGSVSVPAADSVSFPASQTHVPSAADSSQILTVATDGVLTDRVIRIPRDYRDHGPALAVTGTTLGNPATNIRLKNITIIDETDDGVGIDMGYGIADSVFENVTVVANRMLDGSPFAITSRNSYVNVKYQSPFGPRTGQMSRLLNGGSNLLLDCEWWNCDRGPLGTTKGDVAERNAFVGCYQHDTGLAEGASEGVLFENCWGSVVTGFTTGASIFVDSLPADAASYIAAGRYAALMPLDSDAVVFWGKIVFGTQLGAGAVLGFSSVLPPGRWRARIGPASVENLFTGCRFERGKSAICFFGPSIRNRIVGNVALDLDDFVNQLIRNDPQKQGFEIENTIATNTLDRVRRPKYIQTNSYQRISDLNRARYGSTLQLPQ